MLHPIVKRSFPVALSAALLIGAVPPVSINAAATAANTLFTPAPIGKVSLGSGSYMQLQDVQQLGQTVRYTVSIVNNGASDLEFIDYWVKLRSVTGTQFTVNLSDKDKDKNRIPAKTTETFTFYSNVSPNVKLSDLKFDFVKWDFSTPSFQRYLGSVRVPATYTTKTPVGKKLSMRIDGTSVAAQLKRSTIAKTDDEYSANLSFVFENVGLKSVNLPAYQFTIVTGEGLSYPLEVEDLSGTTSIHPKFTKELTLKGSIPASVSIKYMKLMVTEKVNESLQIPVASFIVPSSTTAETVKPIPVGGKYEMVIENQKVSARISRSIRNENDKNYLAAINFSFVNNGTEPVTLPKYSYAIKTSAGLTYPITVNMDGIRLDPRVEKDITLNASVPNSVGKAGWKLVLQKAVDVSKPEGAKTTVATYELPNDNPVDLNQGSTYSYSNNNGTYNFKLQSVQRLPWQDDDILSAEVIVSNPGKESLPIPDITGYFMLDGKIKVEASPVVKDAIIAVKPGDSLRIQLISKIPYTYNYSKMSVGLQEGKSETERTNIVEFAANKNAPTLPVIQLGNAHQIEGIGRSAKVSVRDVRTYSNVDSNLFTVLVDIQNLEKRSTIPATLVGHFRTPDGLVFPATFNQVNTTIAPMATGTIMATSVIPKSVPTSDLQLILGEGIAGGKLSEGTAPDSYMSAVNFTLPEENEKPYENFENMTIYPFTLTMNNVRAHIATVDNFIFSFHYDMSKSMLTSQDADEHKLLVEFVDSRANITFSKQFSFVNSDDANVNDLNLYVGSHEKQLDISNEYLLYKVSFLGPITVKIYDIYKNQKKLISQEEITWN